MGFLRSEHNREREPALVFRGDLFDLANEGLAGGNLRKTGEVEMVTLDTSL
jgi:hypothetical protein